MARYRKIDTRIWTDAKFNELSPLKPSGQALFLYLLTARESTMLPGLMSISEAGLAERLGWSMRAFRKAWREIEHQKIAEADWKRQLVWLPNAAKYNEPANPNVVKGWFKHYDELPECELREVALRNLYAFILSRSSEFRKAFEKAFAEPLAKGLRKQEQEQKQKQSSPHSAAVDTSSDDTTTAESAGDGDGFVSESIPDRTEVLDAVDEFETAIEAHSEPPPIAEPDPIAETPQAPTEPSEKRQWAVGRDLEELPDAEPLTKLDIDKALRARKLIRGTVGSHAWGKLGPMHEASPLTAGELRHGLRLASDPNVVAPLSYAAGCIENLRESSASDAKKVSPIRKPEPEHVYRERCVQAFLQLQRDTGFPEDVERARYEALNGMPTDGDVCSYRKANGNWDDLDAHRMENIRKAMAMVSL